MGHDEKAARFCKVSIRGRRSIVLENFILAASNLANISAPRSPADAVGISGNKVTAAMLREAVETIAATTKTIMQGCETATVEETVAA
jgi:hypothetical protein